MSSKYKTAAKAELIAIYRLEFYKKQRNWKFCKDVCKDSDAEPTRLEPESQPEAEKPQETDYHRPCLNETYNIAGPDNEGDECEPQVSELNYAFVDNDSDNSPPTTPPDPDASVTWPEAERLPEQVVLEQWAEGEARGDAAGVWARAQLAWQHVAPEAGGEGPGSPALSYSYDSDEASRASGRSLRAFLRGAAAAPHSSERDLRDSSGASLAGLSARQLAARAAAHRARLAHLEREARARHAPQQRVLTSLSLDYQAHLYDSDEPPTRDWGPAPRTLRPHPLAASYHDLRDPFMMGSTPPGFEDLVSDGPFRDPRIRELYHDPKVLGSQYDPTPIYNDPFSESCNYPWETVGDPPVFYRNAISVGSVGSDDPFIAGSFRNIGEGEMGRGRGRLRKERVIGIGMGRPYRIRDE